MAFDGLRALAARRENPHGQAMGRLVVCAIAGALLGTALFAADSGSDCMKCAECLDDLYRCQEQRDNLWWGFVFGLGVAGAGWLSFRFNRGKWWLVGTLFGFALAGTATIHMWTACARRVIQSALAAGCPCHTRVGVTAPTGFLVVNIWFSLAIESYAPGPRPMPNAIQPT